MKQINYTFIIPHHNSPELLIRCLDSIPKRPDIEVIVVDDNSQEDKKPFVNREDTQVVLLNKAQSNGAGRARNIGLSMAKGKWLLFADCDDYYVNGFIDVLDRYLDSNYDVIYYNFYQYHEGKEKFVYEKISNYIRECAEGYRDVDYVKYRNNAPWNKMVKRQFVKDYHISFEEVPVANDMFYSYQLGFLCSKYLVVNEYLYNYIIYGRSQTNSSWNEDVIRVFLENQQKYNGMVEFVHHKEWTHGMLFLLYQLYRRKYLKMSLRLLIYYFRHKSNILTQKSVYPNLLKSMK